MSNVLVTGGAGAIGSNLVTFLRKMQHIVTVIDDLSSGYKDNVCDSVNFLQGSILDESFLESVFVNNKIEYVFHLAALFANQNSVNNPDKDLLVNGLGTLNVLEKSKLHNVKRVVYTSSSCVYGNMEIMNENEPLTGILDTPYAITKLLGEQYCKFYAKFHNLPVTITRLFNSYGPGEQPGKYRNVIPNFFQKATQGESLIITGTGQETRDFTYVDDIVSGLYKACFHCSQNGEIFNLGSGKPTSISELVNLINKISGNKAQIIYQPRRNWDHVLHRVAVIDKAKNFLGYAPITDIQDGLQKTFNWFSQNA